MSENAKEISVRLATGFAAICDRFMPIVQEGVERAPGKEITFGATVKCKFDPKIGCVVGQLVPHSPKIPTEQMGAIAFILGLDESGQLEFLFPGTVSEMRAAAEASEQPENLGSMPVDNAEVD